MHFLLTLLRLLYSPFSHNSVIAAFVGWEDCRNDRKKAIRFGNDEIMDETVLEAIAKFMEENKVSYKWQKGKSGIDAFMN